MNQHRGPTVSARILELLADGTRRNAKTIASALGIPYQQIASELSMMRFSAKKLQRERVGKAYEYWLAAS